MKKILFFSPYGSWNVHNQVDAVLASAMRVRNTEAHVVRCDGFYEKCYVLAHSKNKVEDCAACAQRGNQFFGAFQVPTTQLRQRFDFLHLEDLKKKYEAMDFNTLLAHRYCGMPLGREMLPTVCSYFRVSWNHIDDPKYLPLYREYMAYGEMTFDVMTQIFKESGTTSVVMYNGVGYLHSPTFLAAKKLGLDILCHERGAFDSSFVFSANATIRRCAGMVSQLEAWKDIPLEADELLKMKDFFLNREGGRNSNLPAFQSFSTDPRTVRAYLNIPADARIVTVFDSTEYELMYAIEEHEHLPTQKEVIDSLIAIFWNRPEYLVIRHHPNIAGGRGGTPPEFDMLQWGFSQAKDLPPNVRVLMPAEKLNSFALLWNSDAVIAPHSSMRVDALVRGIPTASFDHPESRFGMTTAIQSAEVSHLQEIIDGLLAKTWALGVDDLRRIYRTAFTYNFRNSVKFKSFGIKDNFLPQINISSLEELVPGKDTELDRICDHLLHGTPLLKQPSEQDFAKVKTAEDLFFEAELARLCEERRQIHRDAVISERSKIKVLVVREDKTAGTIPQASITSPRQVELEIITVDSLNDAGVAIQNSSAPYVVITGDRVQYDPAWFDFAVEELEKHADKIAIRCKVLSNRGFSVLEQSKDVEMAATVFRRSALLDARGHDDEASVVMDEFIRGVAD